MSDADKVRKVLEKQIYALQKLCRAESITKARMKKQYEKEINDLKSKLGSVKHE